MQHGEAGRNLQEQDQQATGQQTHGTSDRNVEFIKREIVNIYGELRQLEGSEIAILDKKKLLIVELAQRYDRLRELGIYKGPQSSICARICHDMRRFSFHTSDQYVRVCLEDKYRRPITLDVVTDDLPNQPEPQQPAPKSEAVISSDSEYGEAHVELSNASAGELLEESFISPSMVPPPPVRAASTPLHTEPEAVVKQYGSAQTQQAPPLPAPGQAVTREQIRQAAEYYIQKERRTREEHREDMKRKNFWVELAEVKKVAIDPDVWSAGAVHKPISTQPSGKSGPSELSEALEDHSETIRKVAEKVVKFQPAEEDARRWAKSVRFMDSLWKPMTDEKYATDFWGHLKIQLTNWRHGKHAAAKMNEKIAASGRKRAMTREQVGDVAERVYKQALELPAMVQAFFDLNEWYSKHVEPDVADRRINLSPVLSDKSIG